MDNQQFAPFYVGQEVECVLQDEYLVVGQLYTITNVSKCICKCAGWEVEVGILWPKKGVYGVYCDSCKTVLKISFPKFIGFDHRKFRAITLTMQAVTFEQITEQHPVSVN